MMSPRRPELLQDLSGKLTKAEIDETQRPCLNPQMIKGGRAAVIPLGGGNPLATAQNVENTSGYGGEHGVLDYASIRIIPALEPLLYSSPEARAFR